MRQTHITVLGIAALAAAGPTGAHHGFGNFDRNREITLEGTVAKVDFVNPHAYVYIDVRSADGTTAQHRCEMRAATVLRRSGWSAEMFKNGDPITITGAPDRFDARSCYVSTVLFADGTTADRYAQLTKPAAAEPGAARGARLPTGEPNIFGDWAQEQYVMTDARGRAGALVPVSRVDEFARGEAELADDERPWRTSEVTFTPEGQRLADGFGTYTAENPRMRCETTSIIFDWTFDGPVNRITNNGDTITLQYGQLGFTRTIHMNMSEHPARIEPSRGGHSIGRWDSDVLVVDTIGFLPGVLSPPVMNTEQLHVIERFSLDTDTMTLTRSYVAEDPPIYTGEYVGSDAVQPADVPYSPDPCEELTFVDFSNDGSAPDGVATNAPTPDTASGGAPAAGEANAAETTSWWKFWEWWD